MRPCLGRRQHYVLWSTCIVFLYIYARIIVIELNVSFSLKKTRRLTKRSEASVERCWFESGYRHIQYPEATQSPMLCSFCCPAKRPKGIHGWPDLHVWLSEALKRLEMKSIPDPRTGSENIPLGDRYHRSYTGCPPISNFDRYVIWDWSLAPWVTDSDW